MTRSFTVLLSLSMAMPVFAQEQQAGNDASRNTAETFQALIEKCDDVDALMLRARIRLQLPHTTDEARETAQTMLDEGFAICGEGDIEAAKAKLTEALELAEAGATVNFGTEAPEPEREQADATATAQATEDTAADTPSASDKPWWKFW